MNSHSKNTDHTEKAIRKAKPGKSPQKAESLEPCAKPQSIEAYNLVSTDEACDDGVK